MVVPQNHYALAILTGEISNLTVIDFDIDANGQTSYERFLEDFDWNRHQRTYRNNVDCEACLWEIIFRCCSDSGRRRPAFW